MSTVKGVDVASYQSTTYSTAGLDFVIVKATQSTNYVNPKMAAQAKHARDAGLAVGYYHFLVRGRPKEQAAYFVSKAGERAGDILACDWENNIDGTYATNGEKDTFIKEVKRLRPQCRVVLYCNRSFWTTRDATSYAGDGLWIADPNRSAGSPNVKHPWTFHQYSISGGMDRNVGNFPTRAALKKWADGAAPAPPSKPAPGKPSTGDKPVSLTAQQVHDAVWKLDQIAAPDTAPDRSTNPTWQPQSWLKDTGNGVRALRAELHDVAAQAQANGKALSAVRAQLDAIAAALAQLDAGRGSEGQS
ncbi:glycoside hydrolase family 25 protein [Streptomyces violaceusniger]|uniref:glycoside hydrolase family 25 protein n=1 Tax=Streptomyces violaceusniger TaxID=68280 RepID=UPI0037F6BB63